MKTNRHAPMVAAAATAVTTALTCLVIHGQLQHGVESLGVKQNAYPFLASFFRPHQQTPQHGPLFNPSLPLSQQPGWDSFSMISRTSLEAASGSIAVSEKSNFAIPRDPSSRRSYNTKVDRYYQTHGRLPKPPQMHVVLSRSDNQNDKRAYPHHQPGGEAHGILVVGDVHGCLDELLMLHELAIQQHNQGRPFEFVILVGDLCNKGPQSVAVIRHVRTTPGWFSVRGNHDNSALLAALGDPKRRDKATYQWIRSKFEDKQHTTSDEKQQQKESGEEEKGDNEPKRLTDEDVQWMADLPYTICIPHSFFDPGTDGNDKRADQDDAKRDDTLIVHAGLIPGVPLEDQTISTMTVIRTVAPSG